MSEQRSFLWDLGDVAQDRGLRAYGLHDLQARQAFGIASFDRILLPSDSTSRTSDMLAFFLSSSWPSAPSASWSQVILEEMVRNEGPAVGGLAPSFSSRAAILDAPLSSDRHAIPAGPASNWLVEEGHSPVATMATSRIVRTALTKRRNFPTGRVCSGGRTPFGRLGARDGSSSSATAGGSPCETWAPVAEAADSSWGRSRSPTRPFPARGPRDYVPHPKGKCGKTRKRNVVSH